MMEHCSFPTSFYTTYFSPTIRTCFLAKQSVVLLLNPHQYIYHPTANLFALSIAGKVFHLVLRSMYTSSRCLATISATVAPVFFGCIVCMGEVATSIAELYISTTILSHYWRITLCCVLPIALKVGSVLVGSLDWKQLCMTCNDTRHMVFWSAKRFKSLDAALHRNTIYYRKNE